MVRYGSAVGPIRRQAGSGRRGGGGRFEEKPGAMETQKHQQKFLTLECEGRSGISSTRPPLHERTLGYFLHLILLGPGGLLLVSVLAALFNVTFQGKESKEQLGVKELTSGPAGLWREGTGKEWPGLGDSMRGPWTERRSWPCPACVRCGQLCSRCSPVEPRATGCEYGRCGGVKGRWPKESSMPGNFPTEARGGGAGALESMT